MDVDAVVVRLYRCTARSRVPRPCRPHVRRVRWAPLHRRYSTRRGSWLTKSCRPTPGTPRHTARACWLCSQILTVTCALRGAVRDAGLSVCTGLEWSRDGTVLAVCQASSAVVVLWSTKDHRVQYLDTNVKDVSVLAWSRTGRQVRGCVLGFAGDTCAGVCALTVRVVPCVLLAAGDWNRQG